MRMRVFMTGLLVVAMCHMALGDEPAAKPGSAVEAAAYDFIELLNKEKFDDAVKRFDATMTKALPVESLRTTWQAVVQQHGALKQVLKDKSKSEHVGEYDVVNVPCEFERARLVVRVVFDKESKVAGLFLLPVPAKKGPTDVELATPTGKLVGTFDLPSDKGPWPVVLFIAGSGPTDRDGNSATLKNDCLKQLGQALAKQGIAVLRYDKRGVGASVAAGTDETKLSIAGYADDAAAWVKMLRGDKRFTKVIVLGHSEGSLVGILAAKQVPYDALISVAGAGRELKEVLQGQLKGQLPAELDAKANAIIAELVAGKTVADVPESLMVLLRPSVQPFLMSWLKYNPAKEIAGVSVPILVVQGATDLQVSVEDAKLLAGGNQRTVLKIIEDMNHVMKHTAEKSLVGQMKSYSDPSVPIEPKLVEAVDGFLKEKVGASEGRGARSE